jgi:hypothetical protein
MLLGLVCALCVTCGLFQWLYKTCLLCVVIPLARSAGVQDPCAPFVSPVAQHCGALLWMGAVMLRLLWKQLSCTVSVFGLTFWESLLGGFHCLVRKFAKQSQVLWLQTCMLHDGL